MKVVLIKFPELQSGVQESIQVNSGYLFTSRFLREGENQFEIFLKNFPIPTPVASKCGPSCISPSWDHLIPTTLGAHYSRQPGKQELQNNEEMEPYASNVCPFLPFFPHNQLPLPSTGLAHRCLPTWIFLPLVSGILADTLTKNDPVLFL